MVANYVDFILHIEVKTKSRHIILNFGFHFMKNTKWHFGSRIISVYNFFLWSLLIGPGFLLSNICLSKVYHAE